ncbi:uncharacterized protein EV154DRAFT_10676 [Mucor mucedo]|uniref:uncharacterized protein n=1 Tax=Mucor mucedo TaxID=29922 RepID=UPI00221F89AC|nr:uncharacterized protein EV154DRAFT_10676 [Mucor mucedo]KAI7887728.1 hypothetical protein EV154DRAFT_10676 [Mucor mucedo]
MTTTNDQTNEQHDVDEQLIYSAQQYEEEYDNTTPDAIPQILELDLRGVRVKLDRDTLVSLPESLLIAMFPNGLVLGRSDPNTVDSEEEEHVGSEDEVLTTYVDFDSACLEYVLQFYQYALETRDEHELQNEGSIFSSSPAAQYYPSLLDKQPIIVLREELEYYCVVSKSKANLSSIKLASGDYLKVQNKVFAALQKNIARENNVAEQHLIDMLCDAGFTRQDVWGHREVEPNRTCIISMSLVLLQTSGPDNHMATAQKLLLFWRKPARKCWWDGNTVDINGESIRLWARRTWTLELALI